MFRGPGGRGAAFWYIQAPGDFGDDVSAVTFSLGCTEHVRSLADLASCVIASVIASVVSSDASYYPTYYPVTVVASSLGEKRRAIARKKTSVLPSERRTLVSACNPFF